MELIIEIVEVKWFELGNKVKREEAMTTPTQYVVSYSIA